VGAGRPVGKSREETLVSENPKRILVVDDDVDIVEALKTVLEASGYGVDTASSGTQALARVAASAPDLVILDVMMSTDTEGFHVSYKLKSDPATKHIPILMLTAVGKKFGMKFEPSEDEDYLPVEAFLEKPVEPRALIKRVEELLEQAAG
jgi:CheY-like chemotaxis protein